MITIRFWGVRGSIASAGEHTSAVGGNTSCVEVRAGGHLVVFDAGTGLRALGGALMQEARPLTVHLFLSHFHWDHIQGFPFFAPAYVPGNRVVVYGPERSLPRGGDVKSALEAQMRAPHFPVGLDALRATLEFRALPSGGEVLLAPRGDGEPAVVVRAAPARHPNGCLAYRVDAGGRSAVYATDTEHDPFGAIDEGLIDLARRSDVLIYDAQYTEAEYAAGKRGWGHSTWVEGVRIARAAHVGQLVLFHHDPARSDAEVARLEAEAQGQFRLTTAAREGLVIRCHAAPDDRLAGAA